jgi:hypothetical protein
VPDGEHDGDRGKRDEHDEAYGDRDGDAVLLADAGGAGCTPASSRLARQREAVRRAGRLDRAERRLAPLGATGERRVSGRSVAFTRTEQRAATALRWCLVPRRGE